jgi:putative membrane protein
MNKYSLAASILAVAIGAAAATTAARAANDQTTQASKADQTFLTDAIEGDLAEVRMGQLAQQKGQSNEARQFGKMLEQDHSQHLQKAKTTAQQMGLSIPVEPNAKQKTMYEQLSKTSGAQFDKEFALHMVDDHKQDIGKYQEEAKSKGPLAAFAQETLPTLQKHLQTAESLTRQKSSQR